LKKKEQRASGESALFLIDAMSGTTQELVADLRGGPSSLKGNSFDAIQQPIPKSWKKRGILEYAAEVDSTKWIKTLSRWINDGANCNAASG